MLAVLRAGVFATLVAAGIATGIAPALSCTPVRHREEARYVGGDLLTQIAAKAYAIDLVRTVGSARTDRFSTIYIGDTREVGESTASGLRSSDGSRPKGPFLHLRRRVSSSSTQTWRVRRI
jgi:hypothetical protein